MESDANLLLTAENLRLETGLLRGQNTKGAFAFKRVASQTYLVVDELQARILEEFSSPKTVPQALENCIRERTCTGLHAFYDLILKAHRAGVLRSEELYREGPAPSRFPARLWLTPLPALVVLPLAVLAALAAIGALALLPPVWPAAPIDWVLGWLATGAAWSLGYVLAASTLHHSGGEVHRPRLRWFSVTPHFAIDLREACMLRGRDRVAVHAALLIPLAATVAAGFWFRTPWSIVPAVALLMACRPLGNSPIARLLLVLRRRPLLDTDSASLFDAPIELDDKWRAAWKRFDFRVAGLQLCAGLFWAMAIAHISYRLRSMDMWPVLRDWTNWETPLLATGATLSVLLCLWVVAELQHHVIDGVAASWRRSSAWWRRWIKRRRALGEFEIESLVRRHPLLRRLDPDAQLELVTHFQTLRTGPWRTVVRFDDPAGVVGLIVSGRATVFRRLSNGRKSRLLSVMEGDLFGAQPVINPRHPGVAVSTATPLVALTLSREDFQRLVVEKLGVATVTRYVDKHLFLQRSTPLCADWRPTAVARFAELAETSTHSAGGKIIQQGQEVGSLYVLCEGRARAIQDRKPVGKLEPGDFFGEISLLQTSAATADVETNDDTRCLTVNRVEFIRFMSRNHHVALQMERLCSKRLGRPIFPLETSAFDER